LKTFIIAEAGVNHNGNLKIAKKMIEIAKNSGADAVKFQSFRSELVVSENALKADYQKKNFSSDNEYQLSMLQKLEIHQEEHYELKDYCNEKGIIFMSTPFDHKSIDLLVNMDMDIFKIPSGEITNLPHLRKIGSLKKNVILSTGMSTITEISEAVSVLVENGTLKRNITVLHANTAYPTPICDVNLRAMVSIGNSLGISYGYSDHTLGIEIPIAAVALGASCIEKHFTLDRKMEGPDHAASLNPVELEEMVNGIRKIEKALGNVKKIITKSESENIHAARKSICASIPIKKGEKFSNENLIAKRPGTGISPMQWDNVIGMISDRDYNKDDLINIQTLAK